MSRQSEVKFLPGVSLAFLGIEEDLPLPVPGEVRCTFCQAPIDIMTVTEGTGPLKIKREQEPIRDEFGKVIDFKETIKVSAQRLIACPSCSLNIKPKCERCIMCIGKDRIDRATCTYCDGTGEGRIISQGVKFGESD